MFDTVVSECTTFLRHDESSEWEPYLYKANALNAMGRRQEAFEYFTQFSVLYGQELETMAFRVRFLEESGRTQAAANLVETETGDDYVFRTKLLLSLKNFDDALSACRMAVDRNPENAEILFFLHRALFGLCHYDQCLDILNKCISLNYKVEGCLYDKACCYALLGQVSLALDSLEECFETRPERLIKLAPKDPDLNSLHEYDRFWQLAQVE